MAGVLAIQVLTPEGIVFQGEAVSLVAPAWDGRVGVLPGHAPFLTLLGEGPLAVRPKGERSVEFEIAGGVMKVEADNVAVLADRASEGAGRHGADSADRAG